MYAIIQSGGKQYRAATGDILRLDTLKVDKGAAGTLGPVIAVSQDNGEMLTGKQAESVKVEATVLRHSRAPKIIVFHYKRKKQYKKTQGHRQGFTEVRIDKITL